MAEQLGVRLFERATRSVRLDLYAIPVREALDQLALATQRRPRHSGSTPQRNRDETFDGFSSLVGRRILDMTEPGEGSSHGRIDDKQLVILLKQKTGISDAQARRLIKAVGRDRPSLLREARIIRARAQTSMSGRM